MELSRRLEKLGVKQESLFWWKDYSLEGAWVVDDRRVLNKDTFPHCSAFTVAELGGMMCDGDFDMPILRGTPGRWIAPRGLSADINEVSEADARAKMLIYLIEQRLIEI